VASDEKDKEAAFTGYIYGLFSGCYDRAGKHWADVLADGGLT